MKTGGPWTSKEKNLHINALELKAAWFAIRRFTFKKKVNAIHIQMDNIVALRYLVKMGGTKNETMNIIAKEIWEYLLSKGITITAEYLPGKLNMLADKESRNVQDSREWKLDTQIFQKIVWVPEIDLFASNISHQLPCYWTWIRSVTGGMLFGFHGAKN